MAGRLIETRTAGEGSRGAAYGFCAYLVWGAMPLYFGTLAPSSAWEILGHRIVWSLVFCLFVLALFRQPLPRLRSAREALAVVVAGVLIATNWVTYLVAVTSGRVTEAALGYFLNPLVSVALGLLVLGERLRPLQSVAVLIGASGGVFLAVATGRPPWIALTLAFSFGLYGLAKKSLGADRGALPGLTAETAVLAPAALAVLCWLTATGRSTATVDDPGHVALLISTGVVTAVPLLLFAAAAHRVPLVTLGLLQFIAPVMQFATGVLMGEHMGPARWIGFGIVWIALIVLVIDTLRRRRPGP